MDNKIAIIMVQWNRQSEFTITVDNLNNQTLKNFDLFVWNNSPHEKDKYLLEEAVGKIKGYKCYLYHCNYNARGFGRFLLARKLLNEELVGYNGKEYKRIIFLDDDRKVDPQFVYYLNSSCEDKMILGMWSFKIFDNTYSNRKRCSSGEDADYIGTCGCIIDSSFFKNSEFFDTYLYDPDVYWLEDIALTLFCKKINWKVKGLTSKYMHRIYEKGDKKYQGQLRECGGFKAKDKGYTKIRNHYLGLQKP